MFCEVYRSTWFPLGTYKLEMADYSVDTRYSAFSAGFLILVLSRNLGFIPEYTRFEKSNRFR